MPKTLIAAVFALPLLLTSVVLAQNMPAGVPSAAPDPQFINSAIAVLQQQRNSALDEVAQAKAQLALTQSQLQAVQKQLSDLKAANAPKEEPAK